MSKSVMVVDDSLVSRLMIKEIIKTTYPDWTLIDAKSGDEAVEISKKIPLDIITLDYNMPGRNGLEVTPELLENCPGVHIALLTANVQAALQTRAQELGVQFINKPIQEAKILAFLATIAN